MNLTVIGARPCKPSPHTRGGEGFLNKHNQQLETCIIESIITDILQRIFIIISIKKNIIKSRKSKT